MATLYTIGHSTRTLDELVEALRAHSIQLLVDIRSFPGSKRLPHFGREALEKSLPALGIDYLWMKELGGRRKKIREDSPNTGLRNISFRNYADYMLTAEYQTAVSRLVRLAERAPTAYMCAERVFFRCHRMLVSDWLVAHGHAVWHIDGPQRAKAHRGAVQLNMIYGPELSAE